MADETRGTGKGLLPGYPELYFLFYFILFYFILFLFF